MDPWHLLIIIVLIAFVIHAYGTSIASAASSVRKRLPNIPKVPAWIPFDGWHVLQIATACAVVWLLLGKPTIPFPPSPFPPPGPTPPVPPIPAKGLQVMILADATKLGTYPAAQAQIWNSTQVRTYLDNKCLADGKMHDWRFYDINTDVTNESPWIQDFMKRPRKSLPWIIITNGKQTFEGPLPGDTASTMTLLQKYGGT